MVFRVPSPICSALPNFFCLNLKHTHQHAKLTVSVCWALACGSKLWRLSVQLQMVSESHSNPCRHMTPIAVPIWWLWSMLNLHDWSFVWIHMGLSMLVTQWCVIMSFPHLIGHKLRGNPNFGPNQNDGHHNSSSFETHFWMVVHFRNPYIIYILYIFPSCFSSLFIFILILKPHFRC